MATKFLILCTLLFIFVKVSNGENDRIVGGTVARRKFRRHLAHLFIGGGSSCTGTIIGEKWVMSAAHCFDGIFGSDFEEFVMDNSYVYVGLRTANPGRGFKRYYFKSVYIHKDYEDDDPALTNDVSIIELEETIDDGSYFPVQFAHAPRPDEIVVAAGYGVTSEGGSSPRFAMQTNLVSKSFRLCRSLEDALFRPFLSRKAHVCAVSIGFPDEGITDTCQGDSGGPLFRIKKGKVMQYGITSFGEGCARAGTTPWYARVSSYKSAIKQLMDEGSSGSFVKQ